MKDFLGNAVTLGMFAAYVTGLYAVVSSGVPLVSAAIMPLSIVLSGVSWMLGGEPVILGFI